MSGRRLKILIALTYYTPYVSGVTEFARMLAEHLALEHEVTVLATRHSDELPAEETLRGVRVLRSPVMARLHKGVISPQFAVDFRRLAAEHDVVNLHLPMLEAGLFAWLCDPRRLVVTYQCDMAVTGGLVDRLAVYAARISARMALARAARIFVTTLDYARTSALASRGGERLVEVRAPLKRPAVALGSVDERRFSVAADAPRIGFVGRFVEEKGLPVLLEAFERLLADMPKAKLVLVGQSEGVAGGGVMSRIDQRIRALGDSVELRGKVGEEELWRIYDGLDVLALPSVNRYEAFGMVQIEAMVAGALVVASDLPGVRTIVANTGSGAIAAVGDAQSLYRGLSAAIAQRAGVSRAETAATVLEHYPPTGSLQLQQSVFETLAQAGR